MEVPAANGEVFNIGSGRAFTVREIGEAIAKAVGKSHIEAQITGKYRVGDIRHCFADIARARQGLGYQPQVTLDDGMAELAGWLAGQAAVDRVSHASAELAKRGLTV